ncbi:MAG TPA: hypothetical protein DCE43_08220 [Planctomycetaceae bacterium]|nr:hypothetical protein [Planctomycetaceae bacterium]
MIIVFHDIIEYLQTRSEFHAAITRLQLAFPRVIDDSLVKLQPTNSTCASKRGHDGHDTA